MAVKSNSKNMILALTAICLVCAGILGVVYNLTLDPIKQAEKRNLNEALAVVLPAGSSISTNPVFLVLDGVQYECFNAFTPEGKEAWAVKSSVSGFGGDVVVLVGVCDSKVYSTRVLSQNETPGLGAECQKPAFYAQFDGAAAGDVVLKKDGGKIDAITGATITSRAYSQAVSNALKLINESNE